MHLRALFIFVIGILLSGLSLADETLEPGMVEVEPPAVISSPVDGEYRLQGYLDRRGKWGATVGVNYTSFTPINYLPEYIDELFYDEVYGAPTMPLVEFHFSFKRNFSAMSLGIEAAGGVFEASSAIPDQVDSDIRLIPMRLGLVVNFDGLMSEPFVVPYFAAGAYVVNYNESVEGSEFDGTTDPAAYFVGGLAFQLDWLDRRAARMSYEDSAMKSTFLYAEARKQMASGTDGDPDFDADIFWAAGLKVEF